jgi:hypothetical protein
MKEKQDDSLQLAREHHRRAAQQKFDRLIIEREDEVLRGQFHVGGELLLHPTDQQCKDNPDKLVFATNYLGVTNVPLRALLFPPKPKTVGDTRREECKEKSEAENALGIINRYMREGKITFSDGFEIAKGIR